MEVILYVNSSDPRVVNKNIRHVATLNCDLYGDADIATPTFKLGYSSDYISVNYAYVPEFKRYYFCKSEVTPGRIMYLHCNRDVLMSFNDNIKAITTTVIRQENMPINMYRDSKLPTYVGNDITQYGFPNWPFTTYSNNYPFLLEIMGGVANGN